MNLEEIINSIFVDEKDEVLLLLEKYELSNTIDNTVTYLRKHHLGIGKSENNKLDLSSLASGYLTNINSKLAKLENLDDKNKLKYIISEISRKIILEVIKKSDLSIVDSVNKLSQSLYTACQINGYDFDELSTFLHLNTISDIAQISNSRLLANQKPIYYFWKGDLHELDELARNLKSIDAISSVKEFKKLFSFHNGDIRIRSRTKYVEFIIVLFDLLNKEGKISTKGQPGHFAPLKRYLVDEHDIFLIKKDPKHIKYSIKKNKVKATKLYEKASKWLGIAKKKN